MPETMMSARTAMPSNSHPHIKTRPHVRSRPVSASSASRSASYTTTRKSSILSSSSRSSSSSHQRIEKSVGFAPAVRVHLTVGRWELSPEEHYRVWTSSKDTKNSQEGILDAVRHMRKFVMADGELSPDCESTLLAFNRTSRGVEHMRSKTSIAARRQIKLDVVDAVLEEQHRQRCEGVDNPVTVAEASMLVSKRCRTKAAVRGGEDAAMARVINRRDSSTSSNADKSAVAQKQAHRSSGTSSTTRNSTGTAMTIVNTTAISRYSTTTFDVVDEEDASVTAVVDPASLTAVSLTSNSIEGGGKNGHHSTAREDRVESDTMFSNISHKRLRDKLMQRVSGLALGA